MIDLRFQGYLGKDGEILDGMDGPPVFFEKGGKRWFRTGDIGEYDNEGKFDRLWIKMYFRKTFEMDPISCLK